MEKRIFTQFRLVFIKSLRKETIPSSELNGQPSILLLQSLALLLSFILLINAIGYYPIYKLKQWEIQSEMKSLMRSNLANEKLTCISISDTNANELEWEWEWEGAQEFTYKNNRYDVVRTEVKDHITRYYCIQDTQETQLIAQLEQKVEQQMADEKIPLQKTAKKLLKGYSWIVPMAAEFPTLNPELQFKECYATYHCSYTSTFLNRITPPPKLFMA